jgi:hypothetical protein
MHSTRFRVRSEAICFHPMHLTVNKPITSNPKGCTYPAHTGRSSVYKIREFCISELVIQILGQAIETYHLSGFSGGSGFVSPARPRAPEEIGEGALRPFSPHPPAHGYDPRERLEPPPTTGTDLPPTLAPLGLCAPSLGFGHHGVTYFFGLWTFGFWTALAVDRMVERRGRTDGSQKGVPHCSIKGNALKK